MKTKVHASALMIAGIMMTVFGMIMPGFYLSLLITLLGIIAFSTGLIRLTIALVKEELSDKRR